MNRVRIDRELEGLEYVGIEWRNEEGNGWEAFRVMPGTDELAPLPDLNAGSMLELFTFQRDFLGFAMDATLYEPKIEED